MGSHSKQETESFRSMIEDVAAESGTSPALAGVFYPLWWLWEHRTKAAGALLALAGLALTIWLAHDVVAYAKAERRTKVDATLVSCVKNERYNRKDNTYETSYDNTYSFYVDDEPQRWTEHSSLHGAEVRHLRLYWGEDGKWHRFEPSRNALAGIGAMVLGILLVIFGDNQDS